MRIIQHVFSHRTSLLLLLICAPIAYLTAIGCTGEPGITPSPSASPQKGVVYFLNDHLGNTQLVTDSLGNVAHEESRYPYGVDRQKKGDATAPHYSYTGKEYDEETGLIYPVR